MDFDDTPSEAAFRSEAREFIRREAPHHLADALRGQPYGGISFAMLDESRAWQRKKFEAGWACPDWPKEYGGRNAKPIEVVIWSQEEGDYAELCTPYALALGTVGPTLQVWGSAEQQAQHLRNIAAGEEIWCQLFSEPSAGSDIAAVRTRAVQSPAGDWIINGQKVWTSGAHASDYGMILVRTDPSAPKHLGLTMFIVDMKAEGVDVRPIKKANGKQDFNEVFLTDVRIMDSARLGLVNGGWKVTLTTLMNERFLPFGPVRGVDSLIELCEKFEIDGLPAKENSAVKARLGQWIARAHGLKNTNLRTISALSQGDTPGPENSIAKLVYGVTTQEVVNYALDLLGQASIVIEAGDDEKESSFQKVLLASPSNRIGGGTDEIMRNIIGERVLGLPAGPRMDKNKPIDSSANA
jgi:alkylation response protein AidB-like acyl-CoA dehydrogenase